VWCVHYRPTPGVREPSGSWTECAFWIPHSRLGVAKPSKWIVKPTSVRKRRTGRLPLIGINGLRRGGGDSCHRSLDAPRGRDASGQQPRAFPVFQLIGTLHRHKVVLPSGEAAPSAAWSSHPGIRPFLLNDLRLFSLLGQPSKSVCCRFSNELAPWPSVPRWIACRERLLRGFVNHSFFRLANVFFSLEPIVHGGSWSVATPPIELLSTQTDALSVGKALYTSLSCISCRHLFTSILLDGSVGDRFRQDRVQIPWLVGLLGKLLYWRECQPMAIGAYLCLRRNLNPVIWGNRKRRSRHTPKVWNSIAGSAFSVGKRSSSAGWYAGVADLTDANALKMADAI
jgi:hypothetical protein